jgi:hypothetical protein
MVVDIYSALAPRKQDLFGQVEQHSACPGSEDQTIQEVVHVNSWCLFMHRQVDARILGMPSLPFRFSFADESSLMVLSSEMSILNLVKAIPL